MPIVLGTLLLQNLWGYTYNDSLLLIYAKIVPRIMALDHTPRERKGDIPVLCILYEKGDEKVAKDLAISIGKNASGKNREKNLVVRTLTYHDVDKCDDATSFLLLPAGERNLKRALREAHTRKILTFAYDKAMLGYGAVISLHPGKRVYPLINVRVVKEDRLELDPTLLQVSKIYRGDER
jgi:hypothetical protein